jgi:hypothetical protein
MVLDAAVLMGEIEDGKGDWVQTVKISVLFGEDESPIPHPFTRCA